MQYAMQSAETMLTCRPFAYATRYYRDCPEAVAAMVAGVARFVRVSEDDARAAMRTLWQTTHQMPEPAGSIALAGLLADTGRAPGATAAVVMTGGNCDTDLVLRVLAPQ